MAKLDYSVNLLQLHAKFDIQLEIPVVNDVFGFRLEVGDEFWGGDIFMWKGLAVGGQLCEWDGNGFGGEWQGRVEIVEV